MRAGLFSNETKSPSVVLSNKSKNSTFKLKFWTKKKDGTIYCILFSPTFEIL